MVDVPETHDVSVSDKTPDFSIELKDLLESFKRFDESMQERGVSFVDDEEDPIEFQEGHSSRRNCFGTCRNGFG